VIAADDRMEPNLLTDVQPKLADLFVDAHNPRNRPVQQTCYARR